MKKILVVDDDEHILIMMKTFMKTNGYEVRVSMSCDEGLDIFYSFQPDVVILDVNIGSADGREMCKKIKAGADYQHIPVIMISANTELLSSFAAYGANAAVEKPFNFSHLRSLIETAT